MSFDDRLCTAVRGPFAASGAHYDAPYWPTPDSLVNHLLDVAAVGPGERLIDLGCGDGRIVVAAARRGAEALGVDIDPERIAEARAAATEAGVAARACFRQEDLFVTDLSGASVVTLYLLPVANRLLGARLRTELAPGSRVVSHAWPIEGWPADRQEWVDGRVVYSWTVPNRTIAEGSE